MKVKCDFYEAVADGNVDQLILKDWSRVVISSPKRVTITTCPLHQDEFLKKVDETLAPFKGGSE